MADPDSTTVYVYFIGVANGPIKIGVSGNPPARLRKLQTAHYQTLILHFTIECQSREHALELEAAFHHWYGPRRINNEWFGVPLDNVAGDVHLLSALSKGITVRQHKPASETDAANGRRRLTFSPLASFDASGRVDPNYQPRPPKSPFSNVGLTGVETNNDE